MSPVSGRSKRIGVVLALVAVVCFIAAWTLYKKYGPTPVSTSATERTTQVGEKNP